MKVRVPEDHGAAEILREEDDAVVVRPRRFPGDTYPSLWFWFQVLNDTGRGLPSARIEIEGLTPGADTYEPFWKHCLWSPAAHVPGPASRDPGPESGAGVPSQAHTWDRIPETRQRFGTATLMLDTSLDAGHGIWIAATFPLPFGRSLRRSEEWAGAPASGLSIRRRELCLTVEGRPLHAFRVTKAERAPERHLLLIAGQHAVEQSGKIFAEVVLDGYHSGAFAGTPMEALLATHTVTVVPLANPDGCFAGRMNTNAAGVVVDDPADNSVETRALLALIDELRPHVLVNCHGWANEQGEPPYEDLYRWTDDDPLFAWLRERVPGCSTSSFPHRLADRFRLECHARERWGTECVITELNWNAYLPPGGGPPRRPAWEDLRARAVEYFEAIARFCMEH
jgi:hypothetical protein